MKSFGQLTEPEVLALAISSEEEDGRTYADFAEGLREEHPDTAKVFSDMAGEEDEHRRTLIDSLFIEIWKSHSACQTARRSRLRAAKEALASSSSGN